MKNQVSLDEDGAGPCSSTSLDWGLLGDIFMIEEHLEEEFLGSSQIPDLDPWAETAILRPSEY